MIKLSTSVVRTIHHNLCHYALYIIRSSLAHTVGLAPVTHTILMFRSLWPVVANKRCYTRLTLLQIGWCVIG